MAEKRRSTLITGTSAFLTAGVFSFFFLLFSYFQLSFLTTCVLLPLILFLCWVVIRANKGSPSTLKGVSTIKPTTQAEKQQQDEQKKRYTLVAHPINHYGEKLRWCMDLIGAPYVESNVAAIILVFLRGRSVPWLVDTFSCSTIGNSDEALSYLFGVHVPTLPPSSRSLCHRLLERTEEAMKWEGKLSNLGHLVQGGAYYHLLGAENGDPTIVCWGGEEPRVPWYERMLVKHLYYPVLKPFVRKVFRHDGEKGINLQKRRMEAFWGFLDEVDEVLSKNKYLTGDEVSYVDITLCSLLGPLLASKVLGGEKSLYAGGKFTSFDGFFQRMGVRLPKEMIELENKLLVRRSGQYVLEMYTEYRMKRL